MSVRNDRDTHIAATAPDPFADDVLERLVRSNGDYQRAHGHYIVPLAERLLAARAEIAWLRERNIRLMELASRG